MAARQNLSWMIDREDSFLGICREALRSAMYSIPQDEADFAAFEDPLEARIKGFKGVPARVKGSLIAR